VSRVHRDDPDVIFHQGREAAARLIRVLGAPDRAAQLVAAQALITVDRRLPALIEAAKRSEPAHDPWPGEQARAEMLALQKAASRGN
jgi:hypothetical protein